MLIDSHCHIHDPQYHFDAAEILARARYADVQKVIVIGTSPDDNRIAQAFAEDHDGVYWSYGAHPGESNELLKEDFQERIPVLGDGSGKSSFSKLVAIGEIGLDYHYQPFNKQQQIKLFEQMLDLAQKHNLPVIFHVREAFDDFWPIVDNAKIKKAVLHSFSDNKANLQQAIQRNFYIGVNGLATFTNIPLPPLEYMLLETDAPYLTPKPFRGKINEPSYVKNIAEWVADKLEVPFDAVAATTTQNATELFNLQD
ncbi:TatD family hydrolase [Candidatus Saccharibacteria bacterium]|nr:TatD family hydrolase [Candidatus Saccharibacteria bacterium]